MILLHCELERYDGIFLIRALSSEVKADVNFPLYQRSVKIVDNFLAVLVASVVLYSYRRLDFCIVHVVYR